MSPEQKYSPESELIARNEREKTLSKIREQVESIFSLGFLEKKNEPLNLGELQLDLPHIRLNHYLIRSNDDSEYHYGESGCEVIRNLISFIENKMEEMGITVDGRYCYLTIDQGFVDQNTTLRTPGWHIDGMQGDEVPIKKPSDLAFIWSDQLPTLFANQRFDVAGLDSSIHNVFTWLDKQVDSKNVFYSEINHVYAITPYNVHAAKMATEPVYRRFVRVSYTMTPVTSTRMSVNQEMVYNYQYHTTTGEIPKHLK